MAPLPLEFVGQLIRFSAVTFYLLIVLRAWLDLLPGPESFIPVHEKETETMGYLNRFKMLKFPELAGTDAEDRPIIWVQLRNPRLMAGELAAQTRTVELGPDGRPLDTKEAIEASYEQIARMVVGGFVFDATWDGPDEETPVLAMPPSPRDVGKYPIEILNAISEEMAAAIPK